MSASLANPPLLVAAALDTALAAALPLTSHAKTFKPRGLLAAEWKQISPTQLRLPLRPGVKFSDGSDFSAADAKFSLERDKAKSANFRVYALGVDDSAFPASGCTTRPYLGR